MIGYLDCSTGVSGDKFLGALLDVGTRRGAFNADDLRAVVAALAPEAIVEVVPVVSRGISAVGVSVRAEGQPHSRTWASIRSQIENAELPRKVREPALAAFGALAVAEAAAHGTDVDSVHFHEVGAIDSIVDIVGVCAGMYALGIERLVVSAVAVGSGTVQTSHGTLPVPAPATASLLEGVPVLGGPAAGELTTPTGAALLVGLADGFGPMPALTVVGSGYGAGTRDIGCPNVCRLLLGTAVDTASDDIATSTEAVTVLETNVDHASAEELAFAAEELFAEGALDVWQTPIVMKKGRSAVTLSVLVPAVSAAHAAARIMALTGTLGVRMTPVHRFVAAREVVEVDTAWGTVRAKSGAGRVRPEHEDVARIAREHGLPYHDVAREIRRLAAEQLT